MGRKYAKATEPISIDILREAVRYEPETGRLFWMPRPRSHFADNAAWRTQHRRDAGREIRRLDSKGYIRFALVVSDLKYAMSGHWAAWALCHGVWPDQFLDHANGIRTDNRIANLRAATKRDNQRNRGKSSKNKTGLKFVSIGRWGKGFQAVAVVQGKSKYMGSYPTAEEAHQAAIEKLAPVYGEFLNDGKER